MQYVSGGGESECVGALDRWSRVIRRPSPRCGAPLRSSRNQYRHLSVRRCGLRTRTQSISIVAGRIAASNLLPGQLPPIARLSSRWKSWSKTHAPAGTRVRATVLYGVPSKLQVMAIGGPLDGVDMEVRGEVDRSVA